MSYVSCFFVFFALTLRAGAMATVQTLSKPAKDNAVRF